MRERANDPTSRLRYHTELSRPVVCPCLVWASFGVPSHNMSWGRWLGRRYHSVDAGWCGGTWITGRGLVVRASGRIYTPRRSVAEARAAASATVSPVHSS